MLAPQKVCTYKVSPPKKISCKRHYFPPPLFSQSSMLHSEYWVDALDEDVMCAELNTEFLIRCISMRIPALPIKYNPSLLWPDGINAEYAYFGCNINISFLKVHSVTTFTAWRIGRWPPFWIFRTIWVMPPPHFGRGFFGRRLSVIWACSHDTLFLSPKNVLSFFKNSPPLFKKS